ncbi:MAG TPA: 16S rRNA (cytidine(1402)-2'-O)-methyltransferase [Thiobacillaceae bacterium]|nr:16S rRNA (cytidine(1402)-2'-O)-methyltransferase [Thiobacillaceae bacterium]
MGLMPGLYVVATPIGNLGDITLRALGVLKQADCVAAEDTRVSRHLLNHFGLHKEMVSVREHNEQQAADGIIARIRAGQAVAYVTDAGTPAVSDPGARLVAAANRAKVAVVPLPGPNAAMAALSASGQLLEHWLFYGFLPTRDEARNKALTALRGLPYGLVFYESPHRIAATVAEMGAVLGADRTLTIARELSKRFEQVHTLPLAEAQDWLAGDPNRQRGEFVLIVSGAEAEVDQDEIEHKRVLGLLLEEMPVSRAAGLAARITGAKKNVLYELALSMAQEDPQ